MESTVLSVGKSVLNGALSYAKSAVAEEVALQLGVRRDQVFVTRELEMMQAFLMAAHEEGDENKVVKMWVKQVRDVAYNVEDTLQDFAVRLDRHRQSWWCIPRTLLDRRHVAKQMKELKADVEDVSQRSMRYHLIKGSGSKHAATGGQSAVMGETMSGIEESMQQREKSKVNLVRLINKRDDTNLKVIGVWATSTVDLELEGSTSIIKRAYDHLKRHGKFDSCAYLRLMCSTFNRMEFIQNIIRQFYVSLLQESKASEQATMDAQILRRMGTKKEEEDDLIDEFKGYLKEKSYLIVLMDVSSTEQWDQIKKLFPHNKRGSRIIVFTPQVEVATLCAGPESVELEHKQLSSDETLYAFYEQGYPDEEISPEAGPSPNATASGTNNSMDRNGLARIDTMVFSALEESQLIGRVNERSEIIELVSNKDGQELQLISLWGMGGLGKTTLVRDIYQSQEIIQMFEARACATVMRPFNCEELLRSLAMQFGNVTDLRGYLDGKKYLIVLDDISSAAEFNAIIQHLPKMAGSCIVVTTREESIAKHCSNVEGNVRKLSTLNYDDAHVLLMRKVFKETVNLDDDLAEQEELILKKCKGLPLAIVTIGGFLANQPKTALEWRKFNQHLSTELEMNPELETIRAVLLKSYDGLPYHLKSCFLYLAIFPEDHEVSKRRLVRRWIAEGYSREMRGKSAEEMASTYFMEFISRSMILPSQRSMYSRKGIDSCQIHDLIREIIISKSMEENLVLRLERGCILDGQGTARHLVISSGWDGDQSELESTVDLSRIRSLTVFGESKPFFISKKMRLLRVLDLEGVSGLCDHHLVHMGKFLHLKYLSLRGCSQIYYLPDWLGNLRQLETLDIKHTRICKLPRTIIRLSKLRHICAGADVLNDIDEETEGQPVSMLCIMCSMPLISMLCCLACCRPQFLDRIMPRIGAPWNNRRDICTLFCCSLMPAALMRLSPVGVAIPTGIHKLKALQTLDGVNIARGKATLDDIKRLAQLRNLGVSGINKTNGQMLCSAVAGLSRLESLTIKSEKQSGLCGCLDGTASPPKNLQNLKLDGNLAKLPEWIMRLKNLMKLKLWSSRILEHDSAIQVLGKLPNLTFLSLRNKSFVGEQVHIKFNREEFPSLVVLEVYREEEVKSFEFEEGATPKLELLRYCGYPSQCTVGYFVGLQYLASLRELMLSNFYRYAESEHKDDFLGDLQAQISLNPNRPLLNRAFNFY